jgi:hypothetical protein
VETGFPRQKLRAMTTTKLHDFILLFWDIGTSVLLAPTPSSIMELFLAMSHLITLQLYTSLRHRYLRAWKVALLVGEPTTDGPAPGLVELISTRGSMRTAYRVDALTPCTKIDIQLKSIV